MLEKDFQAWLVQLAKLRGYKIHHDLPSQRKSGAWSTHTQGDQGFFDLVLAKPGRFIVSELKSEKGGIRPDQREWFDAVQDLTPVERYLWRPQDMDKILKVL